MGTALLRLLVIMGPTASGKTSLGLEVAETLGGEIISADAFAVYRGFDIGTDKPSPEARRRVRHHLVDVADPRVRFSAGAFADLASDAIDDITRRGLISAIAGGSHFYIRALLEGLFPAPPRDAAIGARLAVEWRNDPSALYRRLEEIDDEAARRIGPQDRQRIIRALEVYELTGEALTSHWRRHEAPAKYSPLLVAPQRSRSELYARIDARAERLFANGLVEEVERILASNVPVDAHAFRAIGYRQVVEMLQGLCDLETAIEDTKRASRKFAKRQLTWLRSLREGALQWVPPVEDGGAAAVTRLWEMHTEERREK